MPKEELIHGKNSSFDIVSQLDMQELDNALNQTRKEISQRYDFRGSAAAIELVDESLKMTAEDEYKLGAILTSCASAWLSGAQPACLGTR